MRKLLLSVLFLIILFRFDCTSDARAESTAAEKALAGFFQIAGLPPQSLSKQIGHWKCEYQEGMCHLVWVEPALAPPSLPQAQDNTCYGAWKIFYGVSLNGEYIYRQSEGFIMATPAKLEARLNTLNEVQVDFFAVDGAPTFRVVSELIPHHGRGKWGWTKRTIDFTGFWRHFPLDFYIETHLGDLHTWLLSIGIVNPDTLEFDPFCELEYLVNFTDPTAP